MTRRGFLIDIDTDDILAVLLDQGIIGARPHSAHATDQNARFSETQCLVADQALDRFSIRLDRYDDAELGERQAGDHREDVRHAFLPGGQASVDHRLDGVGQDVVGRFLAQDCGHRLDRRLGRGEVERLVVGPGLSERVAAACHANTRKLTGMLSGIPGVEPLFDRAVFHEQALRLPAPAAEVLRTLGRLWPDKRRYWETLSGVYLELKEDQLALASHMKAAAAYIDTIAHRLDSENEDLQVEGSIAKLFTTESANRAADDAMQALGGYGYIREYPVELWLRNARGFATFDGLAMV